MTFGVIGGNQPVSGPRRFAAMSWTDNERNCRLSKFREYPTLMSSKLLTVAEIYCGAGGLSAGFKAAKAFWEGNQNQQFKIAYGVDKDKDAMATFRAFHFSHANKERLEQIAPCKDVSEVTVEEILQA